MCPIYVESSPGTPLLAAVGSLCGPGRDSDPAIVRSDCAIQSPRMGRLLFLPLKERPVPVHYQEAPAAQRGIWVSADTDG